MKKYLFIFITNILFAQDIDTKNDFFELFESLDTPYIIDEIQFNVFINNSDAILKKIEYDDFIKNSILEEDNRQVYTVLDSSKIVLYAIGKFKYNKIDCFVILLNGNNNFSEIILLFYSNNRKLLNSNTISLPLANSQTNFSSILFSSKGIFVNKVDLNLFSLSKKHFQLNLTNVIEDSLKLDKSEFNRFKRDYIYGKIDFDKSFFTKKHNYLDLTFFKSFIKSNLTISVKNNFPISYKSYFIDSFLLDNNKSIIFFKTDYNFKDYKCYSIIGYQIISDDGKHNKNQIISEYVVPDYGKNWIRKAKIEIDNNYLILKFNNGFENVIEKFKLKNSNVEN